MARKDPSQWSEAYRKRIERAFAKNPDLTLSEARGHKPKPPAENAPETKKLEYELRQKAGNIRLQERLGVIDRKKADEAETLLREMQKESRKIAKRGTKEESLEWTIWSQEQKEREMRVKTLQREITPQKWGRGKKIIQEMQAITKEMYETYPAGTVGYYDRQDELKKLYKRLEGLGLVHRTGDIVKGDVGYH